MAGTAIILVSIAGAVVATKLVDGPIRRSKWIEQKRRRAVLTIAICIALVAGLLCVWQLRVHANELAVAAEQEATQAEIRRNYPGALALQPGYAEETGQGLPLKPAFTALDKQWVSLGNKCEGDNATTNPRLVSGCSQSKAVANPKKTIVVVGDSHSEQFTGALEPVAAANDWQVVALWLGGCDFGSEDGSSNRTEACQGFNKAAMGYVLRPQT
ncbi:SGNH hydrolase domain-containing protein [Arthrobacter psychrolactophilus]